MTERQLRRHEPFGEEPLRPVEIREQRLEDARALRNARLDAAPFL
jgi:hypothetical protein